MFVETKRDGEPSTTVAPPPEPWRDLMLKAADLIDQRGLAKRTFVDKRGQLCVRGALMAAAGLDGLYDMYHRWPTATALYREADARFSQHVVRGNRRRYAAYAHDASAYWNNEDARTKDEVVTELRRCAMAV
jgi:hypothetical protein